MPSYTTHLKIFIFSNFLKINIHFNVHYKAVLYLHLPVYLKNKFHHKNKLQIFNNTAKYYI